MPILPALRRHWSATHPPLLVTLLCCATLPATLGAQEPRSPAAADSARRLERVKVTAPAVPASVGGTGAVIVRPDSLRITPAPLLEDALRATPFLLLRQNSRGEAELSVRGSDSRQAAVLLDGVPLTLGWDHRTDPSIVPLSGVQRIVLVRGLSSLLHGPNVLGGVVELGLDGAEGGESRRRYAAAAGVDQHGGTALSLSGSAPVAVSRGSLALATGAGLRHRAGVPVTAGARDTTAMDGLRTNSDLRHVDGFATLRWWGAAGRHASLVASGYRAQRGVPPELHVIEPRLWRIPDQSRLFAAFSGGTGVIATPFGAGGIDFTSGYTTGAQQIESFTDRTYTVVDSRERGEERTMTARIAARHTLLGAGELRLAIIGADVCYDETLGEGAAARFRQRLSSGGAEAEWPVGARASVGGGVVYDAATTPEAGGREPMGRMDAWGWRAGATWRAGAAARVHASASRRARFPALRELYSGALDRFRPNPALQPETLTGVELGVTLGEGAAPVMFQAIGFHHRLRDAVVRTVVPDTRQFMRVNRDEIRSSGIELLGGWTSSGSVAHAVSVTADLVVQRVRVHDDSAGTERRAEHQPAVRGALDLSVPLLLGMRGAATARYTGAQYCMHPDTGSAVRLRGQSAADLWAERSWRVAGGLLRAMVSLDNATDATAYDQCGLPRPGRTLRLGIQVS